jgi:dihydrofolate synthase/folylpolyglutamate synthase
LSRTLEEWLAHQTQVHPQAIDLGLGRLRTVLERLAWRQPRVPVVTVAGTNGKGSVAAYCTSILSAAGHRVGTFTSPHLCDYRERIRVHERLVTADELVRAFERIEAARMLEPEISLTFFEYNTLAALLVFEAANIDAWVLEVGMGGRLDAVNIVDPSVAVVVSIGLDHQEFLGNTLEAIAVEKAGVFRDGRPAVLGSRDPPPVLADIAASMGARLKCLGRDFDYLRDSAVWHYRGPRWDLTALPPPALLGETQFANAATALAALEELELAVPLSAADVTAGLASAVLPGRFQVIASGAGPEWILDVAHNPDAARVLAQNLHERRGAGKSFAVCGILADKDAAGIAAALRDCFDAWWLTSTDGVRGTSACVLADRVGGEISSPIAIADNIAAACAAAAAAAGPSDRIVVFGSFHTVGPALEWLAHQGYTHAPRRQ